MTLAFIAFNINAQDVSSKKTIELSCPSSLSLNAKIMELIQMDLSGMRVEGMEDNECLKQENFPHLLVVSDVSNEESSQPNYYINSLNDVKILNVKLLDKDVQTYEAQVEFKVISKGNVKAIKERYLFSLNDSEIVQKKSGCLMPLSYPENIIILKSCQK